MCDVCVAEEALEKAMRGIRVKWSDGPTAAKAILFRAMGKGAECKPARYQIKLEGDPWPKKWSETADLAAVTAFYGMDVRWPYVSHEVKEWVTGHRQSAPVMVRRVVEAEVMEKARKKS